MARAQPLLMGIYRAIYSVHMPLFAFVCGICSQDEHACLRQMRQNFSIYILVQAGAWLVSIPFGAGIDLCIPWWHSWFLLSAACWRALAAAWQVLRRRVEELDGGAAGAGLVLCTMLLACIAGRWTAIGRVLSASRTLVFLPYFLAGLFLPREIKWRKYRELGEIALALMLGGLYLLRDVMPTEFLYQAEGYAALDVSCGSLLRLTCYALGFAGGFALMTLVSDRRTRHTRFGVDTLPVYLAHGPIVFLLRQIRIAPIWFMVLAPLAAAGVFYLLYRIFCDRRISCRLVDLESNALGEIVPLWMRWI